MKAFRIILIGTIVGVIIGVGGIYYIFNKPHRNIEKEKPAYTMEASDLYEEFSTNEDLGNEKFGNKVIQLSGRVAEISNDNNAVSIILNNNMQAVNCTFGTKEKGQSIEITSQIKYGEIITVKGKCDGFDMIMGVVLTKCILIQ